MPLPLKPVKKERYFTHVDCVVMSPDQSQLLLSTNFCKKYFLSVKEAILSSNLTCTQVPGIDDQKILSYSEYNGQYALATNSGVSICQWDHIANSRSSVDCDTTFYSTGWIGDNVIAG